MKNAIRIFLATLLMTFLMHAQAEETVPDTIAGTTKISAEELIKLVQVESNIILIDARKPSDHRKGYIEGSISLPDTDTSAKTLASHIPSKTTPVIIYCNGIKCGRSVTAAKIAVAAGYTNIY